MSTGRRFRYQLDSVLRKHESDMEQLRHRQAEIKSRMDNCARELDAIREQVEQAQSRLRGASREGTAIDPDQQSRLTAYLKILHAEMEDKRVAAIRVNEPVFRSSSEADHRRASQPLAKILRHAVPQVRPPRLNAPDAPPFEDSLETADGRLDFGKLRHRYEPQNAASRRRQANGKRAFVGARTIA